MRIAVFHNRYRQRGGEDRVVDFEAELLRKAGHEVSVFEVDNRDAIGDSWMGKLRAARRARWNPETYERVRDFLSRQTVDVGHVHNFFPVLSPAVHRALRERGVPVVQTLHNYRLLCANGAFLRDGRPCEDCVPRGPWNAVRYGCYRGSRLQTAVWAEMTSHHRRRHTWQEEVDLFLVPSAFARRKLVAGGLPEDRVWVKPNPVADPGEPHCGGRGAAYVGRLSAEKGVGLLVEAWRELDGHSLSIAGTGPEEPALRERAAAIPGVHFLGEISKDGVDALLRRSLFVVVPSLWYEVFPVTVAEAMASGKAVVAPRATALGEIVGEGHTGLLFERGNAHSLAQACARLIADPEQAAEMGREARAHYEDALSPERSVDQLEAAYRHVSGGAA